MTKIDIISGFLGAGKTTLIKKLINNGYKGEKLVLIENEFGEIGVDGSFLKDSGVNITEMNSGCICCSLVGDFEKSLNQVIENYKPDRIIIEPSGVGKLSDVIGAVTKVTNDEIVLNALVAVVDAVKCKMYMKNFGEFFNNQVESAKTIFLSRTQKLSQQKLEECVELIRQHNDKAALITTPWDEIEGEKMLEAMENMDSLINDILAEIKEHHDHDEDEDEHEHHHHHDHDEDEDEHEHHHHHDHDEDEDEHEHHHHHDHDEDEDEHEHHHHHHDEHGHHHHHADEVFTSIGIETVKKYDKTELDAILDKLANSSAYGIILRAKGILQDNNNNWMQFDLTPDEYEIREGSADYTGRYCVIGSKLDEQKIKELFNEK